MKEGNFASSGEIRGLGSVSGNPANAEVSGYFDKSSTETNDRNSSIQQLVDKHVDLHNEIESNDINPKDGNKKVKVVSIK